MLGRMDTSHCTVGLFATCLVDIFRPGVGFAALSLLERAGCSVSVPHEQTCCGQPAYNAGDSATARAMAMDVIRLFEPYQYLVAPSGSCIATIRHAYPRLLDDDPQWRHRARDLAGRSYELTSFLTDVLQFTDIPGRFEGTVTYHDSCSGLRELGIAEQPRALLRKVEGLSLHEAEDRERCCGFGGAFCVEYPEISTRMADDKADALLATRAGTVLGGDLGCLLHLAGRLRRRGDPLQVRHVAEVLAGSAHQSPAIGEPGPGPAKESS